MAFDFEIILRNKDGVAVDYLKKDAGNISWNYDAVGGCGACDITLRRDFDAYGDIDLDYGIEIFETVDVNRKLASAFDITIGEGTFGGAFDMGGTPFPAQLPIRLFGGRVLRYAGFVCEPVTALDNPELVRLQVSGYSRQLEYINVYNQTAPYGPMVYAAMDVGEAARRIIDTFVIPGTQIRRTPGNNLCQDTGVTISSTGLSFETSAAEALKTLAEIGGNAEWGVMANREIYFVPRSQAVKQTWVIGDRIQYLQTSKGSTNDIVHAVNLLGANGFRAILNLANPEPGYYKQRTVPQPAISNAADATLWGMSYASMFSSAQPRGRVTIAAVDVEQSGISNFIERQANQTMPPLGLFRVIGGPTFLRTGARFPAQLPVELTAFTVGGRTDIAYRINSIRYTPIDGGLSIDIDLGGRGSAFADIFKGIEYKISQVRQLAA